MPLLKELHKAAGKVQGWIKDAEKDLRRDAENEAGPSITVPHIFKIIEATPALAIEEAEEKFVLKHVSGGRIMAIPHSAFTDLSNRGQFIGRGSFGHVYRYTDEVTECCVAVKQIDVMTNDIPSESQAVMGEVRVNEKLNHENITQFVGCCELKNTLYIVLEYMEGGSLRSKLNKIKQEKAPPLLSDDAIMKYISDIISGLVYLHLNRVIHRDLRAANVLLNSAETAKIADFGISKQLGTMATQSGFTTLVGNTYWRSPELIQNNIDQCGRKVDVWSLGITILEMIYCTPPFMTQYEQSAYMFALCVKKEIPQIPDLVRDDIKDILKKCLIFEAEDRLHSKDILTWN